MLFELPTLITQAVIRFGAACPGGYFFGLPHWYQYLDGQTDPVTNVCSPVFNMPGDIWLVVLAIIDILLRIGGMLAVGYVIYGGFRYITSQGEPDKTAAAKSTILNAIIGVVIMLIAIVAVGVLGTSLGNG